LNQQIDLKS